MFVAALPKINSILSRKADLIIYFYKLGFNSYDTYRKYRNAFDGIKSYIDERDVIDIENVRYKKIDQIEPVK